MPKRRTNSIGVNLSTITGIEAIYMGDASKGLFGCYHAPRTGPVHDLGIVFCHPLGIEYIRSHRTYHHMAVQLSQLGYPVLRFDFYGCGDSAGEFEEGGVNLWLDDLSVAIAEIRRRTNISRIALVGLRFGGTLAMLAGIEKEPIDVMVLWNPVVSGKAHIKEMKALHENMLQWCNIASGDGEIMGYPFPSPMLTQLSGLDLLTLPKKPADRILVAESERQATSGSLVEVLESSGARVDHRHVPDHEMWETLDERAVVPYQVMQMIISWLGEVAT